MNKTWQLFYFSHRVLGALVIVAGLYLVVWGKSKDHKLSTLSVEEDIAQQKQIMGKEIEENNCHKVITIKASDDGGDKRNQTADVC